MAKRTLTIRVEESELNKWKKAAGKDGYGALSRFIRGTVNAAIEAADIRRLNRHGAT